MGVRQPMQTTAQSFGPEIAEPVRRQRPIESQRTVTGLPGFPLKGIVMRSS
jgi:hypothetical protein